jgi:hypothetical protein
MKMIDFLPLLFLVLGGIFNAIMDVLKHRFKNSIFKELKGQNWIDPSISWHTKWEIDKKLFGKQIELVDKIMSTTLVWITDLWHFAKMLMILSFIGSILLYEPLFNQLIDGILLYCAFTCTFELFFSKFFIRNPKNST